MKRVLVTGGTGFIGANLTRRLLKEGHETHLLVRPGHQSWRIAELQDHVCLLEADLQDKERINALVAGLRPEWIFHLAAYGAYSWQKDAAQIIDTNCLGFWRLMEACLEVGFEAFINAGSSSEYGLKDHAPAEDEDLEPNSRYAEAKASATIHCIRAAREHGANIQTLRLYSAYGPYEDPGRLIPKLIAHGLRGELPPLVNPEIARDFIYVEDVVDAFLAAASHPFKKPAASQSLNVPAASQSPQVCAAVCGSVADIDPVYNVGTGIQTTIREIVEIARCELDIKAEPQWGSMPDRSWDTSVWVSDSRRICERLGWRPRHTLEEGFRATIQWFRDHPQYGEIYRSA